MNNDPERKLKRLFSNLLSPTCVFIIITIATLASALPVYIEPTTPESGGHQDSLVTFGLHNVDASHFGCTKECDYDCIPGPDGDCIAQRKFCWWDCPPASNPPTISSMLNCSSWGTNNWCKGNLSITLTAIEPQNKNVLIDGDLNGTPFTCPAQAGTNICSFSLPEGTGTLNYTATSVTGQTADGSTDWQLDSAAPTLGATLSGSSGQNGWFTSDVIVSVSASDSLSGFASLTASVDGGPASLLNNPITLTGDGIHSIVLSATDQAGNVAQSTQPVKIDTLTPQISQTMLGTIGSNNWYVTSLQVTANPSDATSGIALLEASIDGAEWSTVSGSISLPDGHHTWQFRGTDYAGNTTTTPQQESYIDSTTPNISTSIMGTAGSNGWYKSNVQISATAIDAGSGIESLEVATDGGAYQTYTSPVPFSNGIRSYQFRSTDQAGNATTTPVTQIKVDTTTPGVSIGVSGTKGNNSWYVSIASVSASGNDAGSGVASIQSSSDGGVWTIYSSPFSFSDGIHTYQFKVTDNGGNVTQSPVQTIKIDTIAPILDMQDSWKVEDEVAYSTTDNGSRLYSAQLVIQKNDSTKRTITDNDIQGTTFSNQLTWDGWFNNGSKADAGDYAAQMKVTDVAGNETIAPSAVTVDFSILSLLPSIPFFWADDPSPDPMILPDDQQFTFGNEISNDESNESSSSSYGGESQTSEFFKNSEVSFGATKVEAGETSTFGFSNVTDFIFPPSFFNTDNFPQGTTTGDTTSAILLSILAAAGLGAATATSTQSSENVIWGREVAIEKKSFAEEVKDWIWDHSPHPGNSEEAREEENDGPKSYKEIEADYIREKAMQRAEQQQAIDAQNRAKYAQGDITEQELLDARHYQDWAKEQKLKAAEYADMTEAEKLAAYKATPEYQNYQQELTEDLDAQAEQAKPWWERTWDKTLDWVDNHQTGVSLGVGICMGLVTAAVVLATLPVTLTVIAGAAAVAAITAGAMVTTGTVALNNHFDRPATSKLLSNLLFAAGSAIVTSSLALTIAAWPVMTAKIAGLCSASPTVCARVDVVLNTIDKFEETGLIIQGTIQKWMGDDEGAAETAIQLQIEQMDGGMPGNSMMEEFDSIVGRYGDDAAELVQAHGEQVIPLIDKYGDDAIDIIGAYGDDGISALNKYGENAIRLISEHGTPAVGLLKAVRPELAEKLFANLKPDVIDYALTLDSDAIYALSRWKPKELKEFGPELALRAENDALALKDVRSLMRLGPIDLTNLTIEQQILIKHIAENSTQYNESGQIVLGKWVDYGNGFTKVGRETRSAHYNPHPDMWKLFGALGDQRDDVAWLVNEQVIRTGREGGRKFVYTLEGIEPTRIPLEKEAIELLFSAQSDKVILAKLGIKKMPIRVKELKELFKVGYKHTYDATSESFILLPP